MTEKKNHKSVTEKGLLGVPPVTKDSSSKSRPRLKLNAGWIERFASQGVREEKIAKLLNVHRDTVLARIEDDPEIREAFAAGNWKWTQKLLKITDGMLDRIQEKLKEGRPLDKGEIIWMIYVSKQPHGIGWQDRPSDEVKHTGKIVVEFRESVATAEQIAEIKRIGNQADPVIEAEFQEVKE